MTEPSTFQERVLISLGKIEEHMATAKQTLADHGERIDALESQNDQEHGESSAHSTTLGWLKTPLQVASGGALTVLVQRIFGK